MDVYLNELSLVGQFSNTSDFLQALQMIMRCRSLAVAGGSRFYSCYHLRNRLVTQETTFTNQIGSIASRDQKIGVIRWLGESDWMLSRRHSEEDVFYRETLDVTNYSIAEASYSLYQRVDSCCFSFRAGGWDDDTVTIEWLPNNSDNQILTTPNYCTTEQVMDALSERERTRRAVPIESWDQLFAWCHDYCANLVVADYVLDRLRPYPFVQSIAHQARERLNVLNHLVEARDEFGRRTLEGQALYNLHFAGDRAWFTDESDSNKTDFANALTFTHPNNSLQRLFCPWHAKISHYFYRIHFSWPPLPGEPTYVVYIGPKLTKS